MFLHFDHDVVDVDELVPDRHTLERRRLRQQLVEAVVVLDQLRQCALYTCRQAQFVTKRRSYMSQFYMYMYTILLVCMQIYVTCSTKHMDDIDDMNFSR